MVLELGRRTEDRQEKQVAVRKVGKDDQWRRK
jgi:hypothetical protein